MGGLFARHLVRCSTCRAILREQDDYCPNCLTERVSARVCDLGGRALGLLIPISIPLILAAGLWYGMQLRLSHREEEAARENDQIQRELSEKLQRLRPTSADKIWKDWIGSKNR